ncbi:MAG TPA: division/cell wall cluster transcriptional repressor MraZ [Gammaproteobacteria bacterium]|nr:division/cell wall cluster transcriptional repressor MraZ [Gammaproteobacteria bacterium]
MYRGISSVNLDTKGRFAVPTKYRDSLTKTGATLVVTIDTEEHCLLLYPIEVWEGIEEKIQALPSFNQATRRIQRLLIGHATEVDMDAQGRILLAPILREHAKIERGVVLVGQGKKFEIWSKDHWESQRTLWLSQEAGEMEEADALEDISV